jgi:two-component system, NtrC family, response regulator AtoC
MAVPILLVENELEPGGAEAVAAALSYQLEVAHDAIDALDRLKAAAGGIAVVVLDFAQAQGGLETLRKIRQQYAKLPVILISNVSSPETIVAAMKGGATDFLCKPVTQTDLEKAITRALNENPAQSLPPVKAIAAVTQSFIGKGPGTAAIYSILPQVAWSEAPVLIQGETGSGKEVIARDLHANSRRAKQPFFKLNCAALPSELVESELFGYERGAFTGAFQRKPGIFEMAHGGIILLDEIGDMDVRLQAKLLQVLQDHEFQRIGGKETIKVDVRVIAATHRDLEKAIQEGKFREDLYYRLNVVNLVVPPLRERREDLFSLAEFLLCRHAKGAAIPVIPPDLRATMLAWHWPGNVRELENFVRRLLVFQDCALLARELRERIERRNAATAPAPLTLSGGAPDAGTPADMPILEQVSKAKRQAEADVILATLEATRWNRKHAATMLNIEYKALLYKMKTLGLDRERAATAHSGSTESGTSEPVAMHAAAAAATP